MPSHQPIRNCSWLAIVCIFFFASPSIAFSEIWEGYKKVDFHVDGRAAFLIVPHAAAPGKPWIWRTEFFGHEPQADLSLLQHGFHVAYIDVRNLYGAPAAMKAMDEMYIAKPHCKHHPHSLRDPTRIVNFVLTHTGFQERISEPQTPFGYDYFELRGGLRNSHTIFSQKKTGRVAFLGGSITAGEGWRDLVCEELTRRYPDTQFDFINAGISSLGSTPGAYRFERDVLANGAVDLLFAEAAVNDDTNGFSDVEQLRGMEGIVRQALLSNPSMNIVLLHFVDPGKTAELRAGKTPAVIRNHERVAEHYALPSIDLAREVTERMDAGEFTWEEDFRDLHPSPFGHELYARSIARLFKAAWDARDSQTPGGDTALESQAADVPGIASELPPPLDPYSYFRGQLINPQQAVEQQAAKLGQGWRLEKSWRPSDNAGTRPGFVDVPVLVAEAPGATLSFQFSGVGIGLFVASGPDTGILEYRIDNGQWQACELFTQWSPGLHLPWAKMLASELEAKEHLIELRVAESSDPRSKGTALRIVHFLVNLAP